MSLGQLIIFNPYFLEVSIHPSKHEMNFISKVGKIKRSMLGAFFETLAQTRLKFELTAEPKVLLDILEDLLVLSKLFLHHFHLLLVVLFYDLNCLLHQEALLAFVHVQLILISWSNLFLIAALKSLRIWFQIVLLILYSFCFVYLLIFCSRVWRALDSCFILLILAISVAAIGCSWLIGRWSRISYCFVASFGAGSLCQIRLRVELLRLEFPWFSELIYHFWA